MSHERRIFVEADLEAARREAALVKLSSEDNHYLKNVLRLRLGAAVSLIEKSSGREYSAILSEITPDLQFKVVSEHSGGLGLSHVSVLAVALLKGNRQDLVCEYGTELGVEQFVFWQAERSVARLDRRDVARRIERWKKIGESAARQSGRRALPRMSYAAGVDDLLTILTPAFPLQRRYICSLSSGSRSLRELPLAGSANCMVCGPEGDFSPVEEQKLFTAGFAAVDLGPLTLRSEAAAITVVAMANGIWGFREI